MSSKQEPAQAPATVSQAEPALPPPPAPQPQPQPHFQPHPQHFQGPVVYQSYGPGPGPGPVHYQQAPPVWNQPPPPTIHYVHYPPQPDKIHGYNHFGTVHFAQPMENGEVLIRGPAPQHFVPQQYIPPPQWYPAGQPPPGQFIPTYATNFSVATDPAYNPNHPMHRGRLDNFQGGGDNPVGYMQYVPFVAPIGVMESQAHASASYTANWVSSTSSIPPELRDEPESDNISQYDGQRPTSQLNGDNWSERDEHFSPSTAHQHSNPPHPPSQKQPPQERNYSEPRKGKASVKNAKTDREEKRELTFDERLEKARMQKDRVENEGDESPNTTSAAQGSTVTSTAPMPNPARSNGQRKEQNKEANTTNYNNSGRGRNHQNGSNSVGGQHRQNGNGERDRQPKRDNNYSNRYENQNQNQSQNQHQNALYNQQQNHQQGYQQQVYQQQQYHPQPMNFNQHPNHTGHQHQSNYRGNNPRGRGGYSNQRNFQPRFKPQNQPLAPQQVQGTFMPQQMMDPQLLATINAFQNQQIGMPPVPPRMPLLPGPFGLQPARIQQDVKFRNTWLDASTYPIPLTAVINFDRIRGMQNQSAQHQSYRGRGRGGYQYRGGYRGGYSSGNGYQRPAAGSAPVAAEAAGASGAFAAENGAKATEEKKKEDSVKVEQVTETSEQVSETSPEENAKEAAEPSTETLETAE